ncbi:hypothetical protein A3C37_00465 [Candidatus Peribacteria bacterium RIFCSPHIGHO2_02_FULL_53_20]|nr:MAG: hypothetical protein A3C37_00465 [Candidatus Peribacteria bacterium RIFCSPHIGHO2_02_FULL_53_20]
MINRSQKYTISGILTLLTVSITAGIGKQQEGIPAQASEPSSAAEDTENRDRVFYRNGETKSIAPEMEPTSPQFQLEIDPALDIPVADPILVAPTEPVEADPLPEEELLIQTAGGQNRDIVPVQAAATESLSMTLIIAAAIIGIILLGGIFFGILRFLSRFRPTLSKEAIAPPPVAVSGPETSSPRLEKALGVKE